MRVRGTVIFLVALFVGGVVGAGPARARHAEEEPQRVYLSTAGSEPAGVEGHSAWEEDGVTLSSSDLLFATSAGDTECAIEVGVGVLNNDIFLRPFLGGNPTGESCTGMVSSEPTELTTGSWHVGFNTSGAASLCTAPDAQNLPNCVNMRETRITLQLGSLECAYEHTAAKTKSTMIGSFVPAALGSPEGQAIEITLPPQSFKLARDQSKSARRGCPSTGGLSGQFKVQSEHDGPVQARIVERPHLLVSPSHPCSSFPRTCTIQFTNADQNETLEIREVFVLQGDPHGVRKEEVFVRVPTANECVGSAESANPTSLPPGASCTVVIERAINSDNGGNLGITTTSGPGGAPGVEYVALA